MNFLVISDFNIGGQCTALARAINKYTKHSARCIIAYDDHFAYDRDIILSKETFQEAADLANNWADFYHFGSYIFNWPGVNFNKLVHKRNACIKYYGSYLRDNGRKCRDFHQTTGIAAITGTDFTITGLLPESYYHLGSYFVKYGDMDDDEIPKCRVYEGSGPFRICAGSAGHPIKGYDFLARIMEELIRDGYPVEMDFIQGVSNHEALLRKQEAHACFCSLGGGWGISGVESMFMEQPTLTCLDPFVLSMYPDQPSIVVDRDNLKAEILNLMGLEKIREGRDPDIPWKSTAWKSKLFAMRNFRWKRVIERYMYILDLIRNKERYLQGGFAPEEIYER